MGSEKIETLSSVSPLSNMQKRTKDPLTITNSALSRLKELLSSPNGYSSGAIGVRLSTRRRGCNGLSYTLNYVHNHVSNKKDVESVGKFDESMEVDGVKVYVDVKALMHLAGTVMDWKEDDYGSEFTFDNPNAKGSCECGESFNV